MLNSEQVVRVVSLDYDGCGATFGYNKYLKENNKAWDGDALYEYNKEILEGAKHVYVGSNRQSLAMEISQNRINPNTMFLPAVKKMAERANAEFEPLLYPDMVNGKNEKGSAFNTVNKYMEDKHCEKNNEDVDNSPYVEKIEKLIKKDMTLKKYGQQLNDRTKIMIMYGQIHDIALKYKNHNVTIEFNFYDDRSEFVNNNGRFYGYNKDLIPHNVTLNIYKHNTKNDKEGVSLPIHKYRIEGDGQLNSKYSETVKYIHDVMEWKMGINTKEYDASKVVDLPEMIKNPNPGSLEMYKTISNIINVRANDPDKNKVWNRRMRAMGYINNCEDKIKISNLEYSGVTYQHDLLTTLNEQLVEAKQFVSAANYKPTFHGN